VVGVGDLDFEDAAGSVTGLTHDPGTAAELLELVPFRERGAAEVADDEAFAVLDEGEEILFGGVGDGRGAGVEHAEVDDVGLVEQSGVFKDGGAADDGDLEVVGGDEHVAGGDGAGEPIMGGVDIIPGNDEGADFGGGFGGGGEGLEQGDGEDCG